LISLIEEIFPSSSEDEKLPVEMPRLTPKDQESISMGLLAPPLAPLVVIEPVTVLLPKARLTW
jgi:hypothetical protein